MSVILSIGTANPEYRYSQSEICEYMYKACKLSSEEFEKLKILYARSGIRERYSVLSDFERVNNGKSFYSLSEPTSLEKRMEKFHEKATALALNAVNNCLSNTTVSLDEITHLVAVSCTGMSAPGLDLELIELLGLKPSTQHSCINFMGCYAAVQGLQFAHNIVHSNPKATVLVVCVELCTLHFQNNNMPEALVSNSLFADGAAAVLLAAQSRDKLESHFKIKGFYSKIIYSGKKDMAWQISSSGFLMTLSSYIPDLINNHLEQFIEEGLKAEIEFNNINYWAIHPGGRKILESTSSALNISKEQIACSYEVLQKYGNMSSPSILFVLDELLKQNIHNNNSSGNTIALAFGPGLVMESCLLEYVKN